MTDTIQIDEDVDEWFSQQRKIAIVWSIEDVQSIRPDLSDDQCWDVLQDASHNHDADTGINWDVLNCVAETLFGPTPNGDDE